MARGTRLQTVCLFFIAAHVDCAEPGRADAQRPEAREPIVLKRGPHLLLDDHLIARSVGVERKVVPPRRFLDEPIVTGAVEHQNWQPFLTEQSSRRWFRWTRNR